LYAKLWALQVAGILVVGISKFPLGNLGTKCHLDVSFVERHIVYYKGEGDGFPQIWAVVSFMNSSLLMARLNTKSIPTMH